MLSLFDALHFPSESTHALFKGPAGSLECLFTPTTAARLPINAVICHPHPLFQGTMHNKVVSTLAKACFETGIDSVRFNFRGVGQSAGSYDEGRGETEDAIAFSEWFKKIRPGEAVIFLGFSFGACVAAKAAHATSATALVMIAPPVSRAIFNNLLLPTCPVLIVQGHDDDLVTLSEVEQFVHTIPQSVPLQFEIFPETGHFFHGKLIDLRARVASFLAALEP